MTNQSEQITQIIKSCMSDDPQAIMSAASVANCVMDVIDPARAAPVLVSYCSVLELRQMARQLLRRSYEPTASEDIDQVEMFDGLQTRYPTVRGGDRCYVPRMQLTIDERYENSTRIRTEGEAKIKGADALDAETKKLLASGYFDAQSTG